MASARQPQVAVVGAGRWGGRLAENLSALGALGAIADIDADRCNALRARFPDVLITHDPDEVLRRRIDAVAIAVPPAAHFHMAAQALRAGKDVFVEKPMTLDPDHANQLADLAARSGRILMVGHLLLYQPAIDWLRNALQAGTFGTPRCTAHVRGSAPPSRPPENVLWSLCVHDIAVAMSWFGEPRVQKASTLRDSAGDVVEAHVEVAFAGGIVADIQASCRAAASVRRTRIDTDAGVLTYDELAQHVTWRPGHRDTAGADEIVFLGDPQPLRLELAHFLRCVADRHSPRTDGAHGVAVVRVLAEAEGLTRP